MEESDLPERESREICRQLTAEIEAQTGLRTNVTSVDELPAGDERILVRLLRGLSKVHLMAERVSPEGSTRHAEAVATGPETFPVAVSRIARTLFPRPELAATPATVERSTESLTIAPWFAFAVSGVSLAAGLALGASSASARDALEHDGMSAERFEDELGRFQGHKAASNLLLAGSLVFLLAGGVLAAASW